MLYPKLVDEKKVRRTFSIIRVVINRWELIQGLQTKEVTNFPIIFEAGSFKYYQLYYNYYFYYYNFYYYNFYHNYPFFKIVEAFFVVGITKPITWNIEARVFRHKFFKQHTTTSLVWLGKCQLSSEGISASTQVSLSSANIVMNHSIIYASTME